jgi:hypothetical protein
MCDLDVPMLDVTIAGQATVLTSAGKAAEEWKRQIAQTVLPKWRRAPLRQACGIRLTYNQSPARYRDTALVNLLKGTIDGLGSVVFAPSRSGGRPYDTEDWWIHQLVATKQMAPNQPYVRIQLVPVSGVIVHPKQPLVVEGFVPGSPPLWPGDAAGQRKVNDNRIGYTQHLELIRQVPSDTYLGAWLQFVIEPERMGFSDLDNFCIPATQALCHHVYGQRNTTRIVELQASKRAAGYGDPVGVHVAAWIL